MIQVSSQHDHLQFEASLREAIAAALHEEKAHDLPACCDYLGLASGTSEEAFSSKRSYVLKRIKTLGESDLLDLAQRVLQKRENATLRDRVSERLLPAEHRVSEITRRAIIRFLGQLDELYGDLGRSNLKERLDVLAPSWEHVGPSGLFLSSLANEFERHYLRNDDWSHADLLEHCGMLVCAQDRFIGFLNSVLRPEARRGREQADLATSLNSLLTPDGYAVHEVGSISGHPIYEVVRRLDGVSGAAKNLIFASTGPKPEIILRDAINNDLEVVKNASLCLIYDRSLSSAKGLTWVSLAEWWQAKQSISDIVTARKSLGERLLLSISKDSPGELALFQTYFREFLSRLGDSLPALLPQVYLHYDPLTAKQRGRSPVLVRQRMDFLLLLPSGVRVVLEIDGQHHYSLDGRADPTRYAEMAAEDRQLRLKGYELYRFGGAEFADTKLLPAPGVVGENSRLAIRLFFEALFKRHGLLPV